MYRVSPQISLKLSVKWSAPGSTSTVNIGVPIPDRRGSHGVPRLAGRSWCVMIDGSNRIGDNGVVSLFSCLPSK